MSDKQPKTQAPKDKSLTAAERTELVIETVSDWSGVDMDALYDRHFPHEVDRFHFRAACRAAVESRKPKAES